MVGGQTPCREEVLMSTRNCVIGLCRCGAYHVRINAVTLHLTAVQFFEVARVFKLTMGRSAGLDLSTPELQVTPCVEEGRMRGASNLPDALCGE